MFCMVSIAWTSGAYFRERVGATASTTCSNGRSALLNAARSADFAAARVDTKDEDMSTVLRNTSVLTNMPTSPSTAEAFRPAVGVPTATSSEPLNRASRIEYAACTTMNMVVSFSRARACSCAWSSAGMVNVTSPPATDRLSVRGRSVGRSSSSGIPARCSRQNEICRDASESGSSSDPITPRCQIA